MNSSGVGKATIRGLQEIDTSKIRRNRVRRMDPIEATNGIVARFKTSTEPIAASHLAEKLNNLTQIKRNSVFLRPSRRPRFNPSIQIERASSGLRPESCDLRMNTFYRAPIGQEKWAIKHI